MYVCMMLTYGINEHQSKNVTLSIMNRKFENTTDITQPEKKTLEMKW